MISFRTALQSLAANKLRSILAVLGIVIGVSSVIMMISMGKGTEVQVGQTISNLGVNLVFVYPGAQARRGGGVRAGTAETLSEADVQAVRDLPHIRTAVPDITRNFQIKAGSANTNARVVGTWPDYPKVRDYVVERGHFFGRAELQSRQGVCVLGAAVARTLFRYGDPIDQWVKIERKNFRVIGVMQPKGGQRWMNFDEMVYVPITAMTSRLVEKKFLDQIIVSVESMDRVDEVMGMMETALRRRHRIAPGAPSDFTLSSMTDMMQGMRDMTGAFTILLAGIAAVSLLVGGVGIMNIMLVSVAERTREIGVRKAIGARSSDVLRQFLVESVTISLLGGVLGILIGIAGAQILPMLSLWEQLWDREWISVVTPESVMMSFGFTFVVGVVFGVYPALKASRMDPVEALRYE